MSDSERVESIIRRINASREVCVDVETSGLDWRVNHIVGYVVTFSGLREDSFYLPFRHAGGGNLFGITGPQTVDGWNRQVHPAEAALIEALDRQGLLVFGHHLNFDLKMLHTVGYRIRAHYEDTYINAPLLDEWQKSFSLDACAALAGVAPKKKAEINEHIARLFPEHADVSVKFGPKAPMAHYWRLAGDDPVAVDYAEQDGTSTWQLRDRQMVQIREQELLRVHAIESKLIPILARMTIRGIKVDEARLEWLLETTQQKIDSLLREFPEGFNVRSPIAVQNWLTSQGVTNWPHTAGRLQMVDGERVRVPAPSFPESFLATNEPGKKIIAVRKYQTFLSSTLEPLRDTHLFKGRVHSEYHQLREDEHGVPTGRLSSSHPNMHAVTKRNMEIGRLHRALFVPDHKTWGNADYSQCEPRLLAYYSECKVLMDDYLHNPEADAHAAVTRAMNPDWQTLSKKEFKDRRETGKRINQTLITGGGKGVLVSKYGVPADKVDEYWNAYFEAMPEIRTFQKRAAKAFQQRGYVFTLLGRRARMNDPNKSYVAVNRLLQGGNADVIKTKMVQIDDYLASEGRPMDLVNNIHDDLAFDYDEDARSHLDECLRIMQDFGPGQPIELPLPMLVDFGEGPNWSVATYGEDGLR